MVISGEFVVYVVLEVQTNEAELTLIARYQFFGGNLPHSLLRL